MTSSPTTQGEPGSVCSTAPSWMLVRAPIVMGSLSPRSTAANHTLDCSPTATRPITAALSATKAEGATLGASSPS